MNILLSSFNYLFSIHVLRCVSVAGVRCALYSKQLCHQPALRNLNSYQLRCQHQDHLGKNNYYKGCNMNYLPFSILAVTVQLADVFVTGKGVLQCGCGTCSWCAAACRSSPARSTLSTEPSLYCRGAAARNCSSWSKACRPL